MNVWFSPPVWFVVLLFSLPLRAVQAQLPPPDSKPCPQRTDELWLVSTREAGFACGEDPFAYDLDVRQCVDGEWRTSSLAELLAAPPLPTTVYVHGNRVEWNEVCSNGQRVYQGLADCCTAPPRLRFIIWTWCSDQIRGALRDVRAKAHRADSETYLLAAFLARYPADRPVSLVGYSYGGRIITGGLHLIAGGDLGGGPLANAPAATATYRVALVAPAMDQDWLCSDGCHGLAGQRVASLLVLYNTCDPALQRYRFVDRCSRATALGYGGLPDHCPVLGPVEQLDAAPYAGRSHDEENYFGSCELLAAICRSLYAPLPE